MARLVLHIGTHKTGTTAIQWVLDRVREPVERATGLRWVPLNRRDRPPIDARPGRPDLLRRRGAAVREDWLDHLAAAGENLLVVEENLSWVFDPIEVDRLIDGLTARFDDVRVVAYVRRQDRHLVSHFQQSSHTMHPSTVFYGPRPRALPVHAPHHDRYLDHHARLLPWVRRLGPARIDVRVFERARLRGGDVVVDFLHWLGADPTRLDLPAHTYANPSMGKTITKVGHLLNLLPDRRVWSARLSDRIPADPPMRPGREAAAAVRDRYLDANERLVEMFDFPRPLFDSSLDHLDEQGNEDWEPAEVVAALAGIVEHTAWLADRRPLDHDEDLLLGPGGRRLRDQAAIQILPPEDVVNQCLLGVLARMNAFNARDPHWADATATQSRRSIPG